MTKADGKWWNDYGNIVLLVSWMAQEDYTSDDIAYAVAKPWKYSDEFVKAVKDNS